MQFFDVNCMIGEWNTGKLHFKTAEALTGEMKRLHIKKALVFDSRAWLYDLREGNDILIRDISGYDNLIPVMVLTPLIEQEFGGAARVLEYMMKNRIGAIRLFPIEHSYTLNLWNMDELFSLASEAAIPVLIDCRPFEGAMEVLCSKVFEIARSYSNTPVVLLTAGYRYLRMLYRLLDRCPNIHIDTSTFITFRGIEDVVKHFGSERILFGSRMPFLEAGVSVGRIIYADIAPGDRENIASSNLWRLLRSNRILAQKAGGTA